MRKLSRILAVLAIASAPLAASAAGVGTSMYEPNPIIVHAPVHNHAAVAGRAARAQQIKAMGKNA